MQAYEKASHTMLVGLARRFREKAEGLDDDAYAQLFKAENAKYVAFAQRWNERQPLRMDTMYFYNRFKNGLLTDTGSAEVSPAGEGRQDQGS